MNFKDIRESFRNKQMSAKELTQDSLDKAKRYSNLNAFIRLSSVSSLAETCFFRKLFLVSWKFIQLFLVQRSNPRQI